MKKILTLLFALMAFIFCAKAQTFLSESFESGTLPAGWTIIDSDGDGFNWQPEIAQYTTHSGNGCIVSASYDKATNTALTPDNWLITPAINLTSDAILSFWVVGQDPDWAAENYSVYVATGNTVADFTATTPLITAVSTGVWEQKTIDLSNYTGQTVYIAFRHYNVTDMYYLNFDDISVFATPVNPWTSTFDGALENTVWDIDNNGANNTNKWYIGQAQGFDNNKLYISCSGGVTNKYNVTVSSVVKASRNILIPATGAILSFDYRVNGKANYDYLQVDIVKDANSIQLAKLSGTNDWTNATYNIPPELAGYANLVFTWVNTGIDGEQFPAAIDNITMIETPCAQPTALQVLVNGADANVSWTGNAAAYLLQYKLADHSEWYTINTTETSVVLNNLQGNSNYNVRVQSVCGEETSAYTEGSFLVNCLNVITHTTQQNQQINASQSGTNSFVPADCYYNYTVSQQIYTPTELGDAGSLNSISFFNTNGNMSGPRDVEIYLKQTDRTSFANNTDWENKSGFTKVFDGTMNVAANDWTEITFNRAFTYNGSSNLVLMVINKSGSYFGSGSNKLTYSVFNAGSNRAMHVYNDYTEYTFDNYAGASGTLINYCNVVKFKKDVTTYECNDQISCQDPSNLTVKDITTEGATITWTAAANEHNFVLDYKTAGAEEWTSVEVNDTTYTFTGLSQKTDYLVRVKAVCGENDHSNYTDEVAFSTSSICAPVTDITNSNLSTTTTISWTPGGEETEWELQFKPTGVDEDDWVNIHIGGIASTTFGGLMEQTEYQVRIMALCDSEDEDNQSAWTYYTFTSGCAPKDLPYEEYFVTNNLPDCWETNGFTFGGQAEATASDFTLMTPPINVAPTGNTYISFDVMGGSFSIQASYRGTLANRFATIYTGEANEEMTHVVVLVPVAYKDKATNFLFVCNGEELTIDNVVITTCPFIPSELVAANPTANSVELSWDGAGAAQWILEYANTEDNNWNQVTVDTFNYVLTGLDDNSTYVFRVKSACGNNMSDYSNTAEATTYCAPIEVPYTQEFNENEMPSCWNTFFTGTCPSNGASVYGGSLRLLNTYNASSDRGDYYGDIYAVLPEVIDTITTVQVSFDAMTYNGYDGQIAVGVITDINNPYESFNLYKMITPTTNWTENEVSFENYTYADGRIAFFMDKSFVSNTNQGVLIDNVVVDYIPSCPKPMAFTATVASESSVQLNWNNGGNEDKWDVEYGVAGFTQGEGSMITTSIKPATIGNLAYGQTYDFYLRARCSNDDQSVWVGPVTTTIEVNYVMGEDYTITTCHGNIYDDGGQNGNYSNNFDETMVINPSSPASLVVLEGSYTLAANDTLFVYDGNSEEAPLYAALVNGSYVTLTSSYGPFTLRLKSNNSNTASGFEFAVSCQDAPTCSEVENITFDGGNTFTWTNGYWGTPQSYNVRYRKTNESEYIIVNVPSATYSIPGIQNMAYEFGVQAVCGDEDASDWTTIEVIKEACPMPTNLDVAVSETSAQFTWNAGQPGQTYVLEYKRATAMDWVSVPTTQNTYTLSNMDAPQNYVARVKAICTAGDESEYTNEVSFTVLPVISDCTVPMLIQNGMGTNYNSTYQIPVSSYYYNSYTQQLYTEAELTEMGIVPGAIIKTLSLNYRNSTSTYRPITVWLGTTNISSISSSFVAIDDNFQQVFSDNCFEFNNRDNNWSTITFEQPFVYNGGNLVISFLMNYMDAPSSSCFTGYGNNYNFYLSSATGKAVYCNDDYTSRRLDINSQGLPSQGGTVKSANSVAYRYNVKFGVCLGEFVNTCPAPSDIETGNITAYSVDMTWTPGGEETSWTVIYTVDGVTVDTVVNTPALTIADLNKDSDYNIPVSVYANCDLQSDAASTALVFRTLPTCFAPTNVMFNGTKVVWNGTSQSYNVQYRKVGDVEYTTDVTNINSYTISDIVWGDSYEFMVQGDCGEEDGTSSWVTISFTTPECAGGVNVVFEPSSSSVSQLPFYGLYGYAYSQQIFEASELNAVAGSIKSISFNCISAPDAQKTGGIHIWLGHTTKSQFNSNTDYIDPSTLTEVIAMPSNQNYAYQTGWNTFTFDVPFEYDGESNLVVAYYEGRLGYSSSQFAGHTTSTNKSISHYSDTQSSVSSTNPASASGSKYFEKYRNNIKLDICPPPTCSAPTNLAYDAATSNLTWSDGTHGTPESYEVQYRVVDSEAWTSATTTEPTATLSNLELASTYEARVRSFCSAEDYSDWSNVINFTTPECLGGVNVVFEPSSSESEYLPFYGYYGYAYSQQIFEASELNAVAGSIKSISFNCISAPDAQKTGGIHIWLGHTTKSQFNSNTDYIDPSTLSEVIAMPSNQNYAYQTGWNTFTFDVPFEYDGERNLVVAYYEGCSGYSSSQFAGHTTSTNKSISHYSDTQGSVSSTNPASASGSKYFDKVRNNIKLNICPPPTCSAPISLTFNGETNTLTWEAGSYGTPQSYEVLYRAQDAEGWTVVTTTEPTLTLNDLELSTTYEAQVRANCSETDQSEWTSAISFSTPACWGAMDVAIGTGTSTNNYFPSYTNYNYSYTQQIFKADEIGSAGMINDLKIQISSTYAYTRNIDVYLMHTDQNTIPTSWLPIDNATKVYSGYLAFTNVDGWMTIPFTMPFAYNGTDNLVLIVDDNTGTYPGSMYFYHTSVPSGTSMYYYNDNTNLNPVSPSASGTSSTYRNNVKFEMCPLPTCYDPTNVTVTDVTATTAVVSWTPGHGETNFSLEYQAADEAEWQAIMVEGTQYTLTDLTKITDYNVRVKAVCDVDDESDYSSIVSFTTPPSCFTPENLQHKELNSFTSGFQAVIAWTDEHEQTNFALEYKLAEDSTWTVLTVDTTMAELNNLAENSAYDVRVKAVCGENDESEYAKAISVVTSCLGGYDVDVLIGEGTLTTYNVPVNPYYNYSYTQQIFTKDEVPAGNINAVSFQYAYSSAITSKNNVKIYLTTTDKEEFSSASDFVTDGFQLVYEGAMNCTRGWNTFNFTTPYQYDGQSNLVLIVEDNSGNYNNSSYVFNYTTTTFNSCLCYYSDDYSFAEASYSNASMGSFRANTKFALVGCPASYDLAVDSIAPIMDACDLSDAQVTIRVKNTSYKNSVSTFNASYQVGESIVTENVTPATPIAPQESFVYTFAQHPAFVDGSNNVVVTIDYAEDEDASNNTIALNGVHQVVPATVPYMENFSNVTFNRMGWKNGNLNENKHLWTVTRDDGMATYMDNDEMDAESYFMTSCIEIPEGQYIISYDYNALSVLSESMNVYIGTIPDIANMTLIGSHSNFTQTAEMQNYEYLFINDAAGIYYIAVEALSSRGNMGIQFDNLMITPMVDVTVEILPDQEGLDNGTVTPIGSLKVPYNSDLTLSIIPDNMYHLAGVWVDGNRTMAEDPLNASFMMYTLSNITETHTISVNFKKEFHIIKNAVNARPDLYTENGGYFIPAATDTLIDPSAFTVTFAPEAHYHFADLVLGIRNMDDPINVTADVVNNGNGTYSYTIDTLVVSNYYVQATFRKDTINVHYNILAGNGYVDASDLLTAPESYDTWIDYGANHTASIVPANGYYLIDVNGAGPVADYQINNVTAQTDVNVKFGYLVTAEINNYLPSYLGSSVVRGTIAPDTTYILGGETLTLNGTVENLFHLSSFLIDGVENIQDVNINNDGSYSYTFAAVMGNHHVNAIVAIDTVGVHYTVEGNGIVDNHAVETSASFDHYVDYGTTFSAMFVPAIGYHVAGVTINGVFYGNINEWQFANLTGEQYVTVVFEKDVYTITTAGYGQGTVSDGETFEYDPEHTYTFTATPAAGYHIESILRNNVELNIADPEATYTETLTNILSDYNYNVVFNPSQYTVTATAGANGLITPAGVTSYYYNNEAAYTVTADLGYYINTLTVDGVSVILDPATTTAAHTFTFTGENAHNHTIAATFARLQYTVTVEAGSHGTITPGTAAYNYGATPTFTITPNAGYGIADVTVDGHSVGAVSTYTFTSLTGNHTIAATFVQYEYTIQASAGNGGTITPSGLINAVHGGTQNFTITPANGYHIAAIYVDGEAAAVANQYTFASIDANHTIHAMFEANTYTVTVNQPNNGVITPGTMTVNYGATPTFVVTPNTGYNVSAITVNGSNVISSAVNTNGVYTYTMAPVTADATVTATMTQRTFTINATAGAHGTINGPATVNYGANATYTITPAAGYVVDNVTVDGMAAGAVTSYTFTNVVANHTINATFRTEDCDVPTNMHTVDVTTSTATFMWYHPTATAFEVQYKAVDAAAYTTVNVNAMSYDVIDLTPSTSYVWMVRANCGNGNYSEWSNGNIFRTLDVPDIHDGIEDYNVKEMVNVYASHSNVYIVNEGNLQIDNVQIFDVYGKMVYNGSVSSNNEVISLNVATGAYMVRLTTDKGMATYKVVLTK